MSVPAYKEHEDFLAEAHNPFLFMEDHHLHHLALMAIKLKEHLPCVLFQPGKSYNFVIDDHLNFGRPKFIPGQMLGWLAIVPTFHYWIPTIDQIKQIAEAAGYPVYLCRLSPKNTYPYEVYIGHPEPPGITMPMSGEHYFYDRSYTPEGAHVGAFTSWCRHRPEEVNEAIGKIIKDSKARRGQS